MCWMLTPKETNLALSLSTFIELDFVWKLTFIEADLVNKLILKGNLWSAKETSYPSN